MNKRRRLAVAAAAVLIALGGLWFTGWHKHLFTPERWQQEPEQRQYMLESLEHKHELVGMSREEAVALLGEPEGVQTSFKGDSSYYQPESTLVYYIGHDPVWHMDMQWLILPLAEGRVAEVKIGLT